MGSKRSQLLSKYGSICISEEVKSVDDKQEIRLLDYDNESGYSRERSIVDEVAKKV